MKTRRRPNIVSVHLSPEAKQQLDDVCGARGMTIKTLLGRLICWFVELDRTEQSIVLKQVEDSDVKNLASMLMTRHGDGETVRRAPRRKPEPELV